MDYIKLIKKHSECKRFARELQTTIKQVKL